MNDKSVLLSQAQIGAQLEALGVSCLSAEGAVDGGLRFASLRAPCERGIYFLDAGARLPEQICHSLVLVGPEYSAPRDTNAYVTVEEPQQAFYRLMRSQYPDDEKSGVHTTAIVSSEAKVSLKTYVGPYCIVEAGVEIGPGCRLDSHVVVKQGSQLGSRVHVEPHCTIGATGVAWVWDATSNTRLIQPQIGGVRVGDDVFLGSDVSIVRGSVSEDTVVGSGTVIAHGTKIGHGCTIGARCHLANNVSLAGNVDVGDGVFLGSGAVVRPRVRLAKRVVVGAGSVVVGDIDEAGTVVYGVPAKSSTQTKKRYAGVPAGPIR